LTRLYNRRGFLALAEQQCKLSRRAQSEFLVVFADMDGLKQIKDQYGHAEGDCAILKTSEILKKTFRESDIIARIGGDEFVILHVDASEDNAQGITQRLEENLKEFNQENARPYRLSLSFGVTYFNPSGEVSLENVLKEADEQLYHQKIEKKKTAKPQVS
jgi:two-component system cell cycle response regulator